MSAKNIVCVVSPDAGLSAALKASFKAAGLILTSQASVSDFVDAEDPDRPTSCIVSELAGGNDLLNDLADHHYVVPVVLVGSGVAAAVQAVKAGAFDVVERTDQVAESAKRAASFFAKCQKLLDEKAAAAERIDSLTKRETQVLHLMVAGKPNREIAQELGISTKTLDIHRANLMDKMEARTSADMCRALLLHKTHPMYLQIVA
jgi:FixJ family two-component response regulator